MNNNKNLKMFECPRCGVYDCAAIDFEFKDPETYTVMFRFKCNNCKYVWKDNFLI